MYEIPSIVEALEDIHADKDILSTCRTFCLQYVDRMDLISLDLKGMEETFKIIYEWQSGQGIDAKFLRMFGNLCIRLGDDIKTISDGLSELMAAIHKVESNM